MEHDIHGPDWRQMEEAEQERYEMTRNALDRCAAAGANPEDLRTLARECGITNYRPPNAESRSARVG